MARRPARAARNCYFEERFRCSACRVVVENIYHRPCARPAEECGFAQSWYGGPTAPEHAPFKSQLWRFLLVIAVFAGLLGLSLARKIAG